MQVLGLWQHHMLDPVLKGGTGFLLVQVISMPWFCEILTSNGAHRAETELDSYAAKQCNLRNESEIDLEQPQGRKKEIQPLLALRKSPVSFSS